jgi:hypothetical protein
VGIGFVFDDTLPPLVREPFPNLSHVFQLPFISWIFNSSRHLAALSGVLFVLQDYMHGGHAPPVPTG